MGLGTFGVTNRSYRVEGPDTQGRFWVRTAIGMTEYGHPVDYPTREEAEQAGEDWLGHN